MIFLNRFVAFARFLRALDWTPIRETDVLQFGGRQPTALAILANEFSIRCMPQVGESVNVWVLLKSLSTGHWGRWGYYSTFIRRSKAKAIVVWNDTNVESFQLFSHTEVPVICIQNGVRIDLAPAQHDGFFSSLSKLNQEAHATLHTYFVLSESEKARLSRFVEARFIVHGSLRANHFVVSPRIPVTSQRKKRLGLIVSFPNFRDVPTGKIVGNSEPFVNVGLTVLSYDNYFSFDAVVARAALSVCADRQIDFRVIGKRSREDPIETDFFSAAVSPCLEVLGHSKGEGYSVADDFDYLITIDSTLGFEMLGLGRPVAFFPNRLRFCGIVEPLAQLSFLEELPHDGACWSSAITEEAVEQFLGQWLDGQPTTDYSEITAFAAKVISVDPDNSKLRTLLRACVNRPT
jgi:surface carbohydrate biosynthesis protein